MARLVKRGPADQRHDPVESGRPRRPVDALPLADANPEQPS
jgi:hypothetical protein